jgi:hypothetical protein
VTDGEDVAAEIGADRGVVSLAQATRICVDAARADAAPSELENTPQGAARNPPGPARPVKARAAGG